MTARQVEAPTITPPPCATCGSIRPCIMCHGSGVHPFHPAGGRTYWARCPACLGAGVDHDEDAHLRSPS